MYIAVYAIAKNEAAFARRWMDSMREADGVFVLDTGSTDGTPELLRSLGAVVREETVEPWRFDAARNRSLATVPGSADLCVCTDLDEVFRPGWRDAMEKAWTAEMRRGRYRYVWRFTPEGREDTVFYIDKAHSRHGWRWTHPVHEVLTWVGSGAEPPIRLLPGIQLEHYPDESKSRAQYLPLLELSVREAPNDDRNMHYLGREYLYAHRWDDCIRTLQRHLALPTATWRDERCASMRYIARAYMEKGDVTEAQRWYFRAIAESPELREPWMDMAWLQYRQENWDGVLYFTAAALALPETPENYITESKNRGALPHDLRSIALWHTQRQVEAAGECRTALSFEPENARLRGNLALFERSML